VHLDGLAGLRLGALAYDHVLDLQVGRRLPAGEVDDWFRSTHPSIQHDRFWQASGVPPTPRPAGPAVRHARLAGIDPVTLYRLLALRSAVFVLEQDCAYLDLDGRDAEPDAVQLWIDGDDGAVLATARLLTAPDGSARIGRVATARHARGTGLAAGLVLRAVELAGGRDVVLDAQAHLHDWYARLGFVRDGAEFVEDGIAHIPMRRPAPAADE